MYLNSECWFRLDIRNKFFPLKGEALEQFVQRGCRCSILESVQGQPGWGLAHVEDVPAHVRGVGMR